MITKHFHKKIILSMFFISSVAFASGEVYVIPKVKSYGVASTDQDAVMFLGMNKTYDIKGVCFALSREIQSSTPILDIIAKTGQGTFLMHGLRPNTRGYEKDIICSLGAEAKDFLDGIKHSTSCEIKFDVNGEIINYIFDTTSFSKILSTESAKNVIDKAVDDYAKGVRSPVFYDQNANKKESFITNKDIKEESYSYDVADHKLNSLWSSLSSDNKRKLLLSQRSWIKAKSQCNEDIKCLTSMTEKRITELKKEIGSAK